MKQLRWTKENFKDYDEKHPQIYAMFEKFALQIAQKRKYYSAKSIFHRVRWETDIGDSDAQFKIDDGWISHYARKFIDKNPSYKDLFQFRVRKGGYHE
ncbi:MAG: hypothetical protein RLY40_991 [Pseudomonadota bacterium]|jgi:ABC-type proline/glycine betaine transport system substrate-binding protein